MYRINNISTPLDASFCELKDILAKNISVRPEDIDFFAISRKSVDARNKSNVHFVYSFDFSLKKGVIADLKLVIELEDTEIFDFSLKNNEPFFAHVSHLREKNMEHGGHDISIENNACSSEAASDVNFVKENLRCSSSKNFPKNITASALRGKGVLPFSQGKTVTKKEVDENKDTSLVTAYTRAGCYSSPKTCFDDKDFQQDFINKDPHDNNVSGEKALPFSQGKTSEKIVGEGSGIALPLSVNTSLSCRLSSKISFGDKNLRRDVVDNNIRKNAVASSFEKAPLSVSKEKIAAKRKDDENCVALPVIEGNSGNHFSLPKTSFNEEDSYQNSAGINVPENEVGDFSDGRVSSLPQGKTIGQGVHIENSISSSMISGNLGNCCLSPNNDDDSHRDYENSLKNITASALGGKFAEGKGKTCLRPVIVGSGPAGMFAALALAEEGLNPIIIERGEDVANRKKAVEEFWQTSKLDTESNVQFGEGGAGTFSDGKLMTGIKKDRFMVKVLHEFVKAGAPSEILYLAKPHIGTDNLVKVVENIRKKIISLGGEYRFNTVLYDLLVRDGKIVGIKVKDKEKSYEIACEKVILAIGHSARDTFEMLYKSEVKIEPKSFSVGVRIEHKQSMINKSQYGIFKDNKNLGAADYKMVSHLKNGRSVYTFCMCPGGEVVCASSEKNRLVTNGMSGFKRDKENANSALLVEVGKKDFNGSHPLAGMYFQREIEEKAFNAGGKNYKAPIELVGNFLKGNRSKTLGDVVPSYTNGFVFSNLSLVFPDYIVESLKLGIADMDKKLRGFASEDAVLIGAETRSSSPIRIIRDETMQSNIKGLYPCGEGAGYAGGITSSAVDGLKVAFAAR